MPVNGITQHFENPTSVKLAKFYMNNVFYHFSSFSLDTNLAQDNQYTPDDYYVIYEVEVLAVILQKIGLLRRISSKGGQILIENGKFGAVSEPELKKRLLNFDDEREKLSGWQHLIGLKTTAIHPAKDGGILNDSKLLFMEINGGEIKDFEYSKDVRVLMPHCTPNVVSLSEVYSLSSALDPYFKKKVGVDFLTWLKCISLITQSFLFGEPTNVYQKIFKTAYALVSTEAIAESVNKHSELTYTDIEAVLKHAARMPESVKNLDLLELKNPFFVHKIRDDGFLIDGYLAFQYFQRTILDSYRHTASFDDLGRGLLFERQVARAASIAGYKPHFPPGFKFKKDSHTIAEVDLALKKDSILALLDCKSLLMDVDATEGDYDSLNKRTEKLRGLLETRDQRALELAEKSKGDNYNLDIEKCFSQIISADVEWLPIDDSFFWWTAGIPRVSTLDTFLNKVFPYLKENHDAPKIYAVNTAIRNNSQR